MSTAVSIFESMVLELRSEIIMDDKMVYVDDPYPALKLPLDNLEYNLERYQ